MDMNKLGAAILLAGGLTIGEVRANDEFAVPLSQVQRCLRVAVAAQPGNIKDIDFEKKDNRGICEVEIHNGRVRHEVKVDLRDFRVLSREVLRDN